MTIIHADCLDAMAAMDADSVDAIVSDPPYGLSFMGKAWDHGVPGEPFWTEALRVAKPGAHLVAFGGTRTFHRLTCAIEDAGWEIRDCLSWLYGSGFPKSHNLAVAFDKQEGMAARGKKFATAGLTGNSEYDVSGGAHPPHIGQSDLARRWQGWGTALKPAWEPIILARKPLIGTVAANVAAHGTGALNVDGCRIGTTDNLNGGAYSASGGRSALDGDERTGASAGMFQAGKTVGADFQQPSGRWPANVCLDEDAAGMLDSQSGALASGGGVRNGAKASGTFGAFAGNEVPRDYAASVGGASRFFYTAKASRREREAGLEGMPRKDAGMMQDDAYEWKGTPDHAPHKTPPAANHHPTVKPIALMRWLCRLVTPPNGLILDPFTGSGTTGCAAVLEGFRFVGIEREAEYVAIAEKRIAHWAGQRTKQEPDLFGEAA